MATRFSLITGLSDHTLGITAPIVATTLGAKIIEKHFIIDRSIGGPDASFSLNEVEFTEMVKLVRESELAMGVVDYSLTSKQLKGKEFCRSLYISNDAKAGDIITHQNIKSVRPGFGLHPKYFEQILGKTFSKSVKKGQRLSFELIIP
jgi:pseudaminic acid synthase